MNILNFIRSVRGKLTLSFLTAFGTVLIIFCIVIYNIQSYQYKSSIDNAMQILAESISDEINSTGFTDGIFDEAKEMYIPFTTIPQHYAEVTDSAGSLILKSTQLKNYIIPLNEIILDSTIHYVTNYSVSKNELWNKSGVRILLYPIIYQAKRYIVVVGVPLSSLNESLESIRTLYYIAIPLTLLLSSLAGWVLSKKVYNPILEITEQANNITSENLGLRLTVNKTDYELSVLSETLNNMIERLEKSFGSLKKFTSDASHELRTPLTILRGQIEVSLERKRTSQEYETALKDNLDEVLRLQLIVDKLLILNQLESGRFTLDKKPVNINELVIDVIAKINFIAATRRIKINLTINDKDMHGLEVSGDYNTLYMAVFNILENAIKYSRDNSEIYCSIFHTTDNQTVTIEIKDKGIGIKEENIKNIFDRFYRADSSRTRENTISLGLGLSIAQGVIESHQGKIDVESTLGAGSIFRIILPYSIL